MTRSPLIIALALGGIATLAFSLRPLRGLPEFPAPACCSAETALALPDDPPPAPGDDGKDDEASEKKPEPPAKIEGTGIIEGKVTLKGEPPNFDQKVEVPGNHQDKASCEKHVQDERLIAGKEKELKNAVVYIEDWAYRAPQRPKPREEKLDNKNCMFRPHVLATTVGSKLTLKNSDGFIHNSRGLLATDGINVAIPPKGDSTPKTLRKAGWGVMKCDFHPWMTAHVHVFAHEMFAVTAADGSFTIYNVPPGTYKLKLWHESLAPSEREITVTAEKTEKVELTLEAYKD